MTTTRILLVDANPIRRSIWRSTLVAVPHCLLVGDSGDMVRGGQMALDLRPDVTVIGHELPESGGLHLARRIADQVPETKVLMVSTTARSADLLQALRAGVRDYLLNPTPHELRAAITRLAGDAAPQEAPAEVSGRVISCFALKGGVGQSSLALNLAIALHQETGQGVALLDLNGRQGQLDLLLDVYPEACWLDVVGGAAPLERLLQPHRSGITFVQASRRHEPLGPDQVQGLLHLLQGRFAYVVVDTDRRPSAGTMAALRRAEPVLIPLRLNLGGLRATQLAMQLIDEAGIAPGQVQLVAVGVGPEAGLTLSGVSDLLKHPLTWQIPDDGVTAGQAVDRGVPYLLANPRSELSRQVRLLARQLTGEDSSPVKSQGLSGLWQRWRTKGRFGWAHSGRL